MTYTHQLRQERQALTDWMVSERYTHAITLNADRELTCSRLEDIFSTFCHRFDKNVHRIRNMELFPAELRLRAIVFPEKLSTNAHLHGFADFGPALKKLGSEFILRHEAHRAWKKSTRNAGSVELVQHPDVGWADYSTKRYDRTFFLASSYHPH